MQHMPRLDATPGGRRHTAFEAERHQRMIGGMEFHFVDAFAVTVEAFQLRHIAIGLHRQIGDLRRARMRAEFRKPVMMRVAARMRDRVHQGAIGREKIHVFEGRRLVGDVVGFEMRARPVRAHGRIMALGRSRRDPRAR